MLSLIHCIMSAYKCFCSCAVCSSSGVSEVMYLSLPHWYTEAPKHNLSWGSRVGFLDSIVLIFCLHLPDKNTSTCCYHGDSLFCISCLQRGEQDLCVLVLPVKANFITSCESIKLQPRMCVGCF